MNLNKLYYKGQVAFSLIEMLMALLVASLLMTALAPVMTRRINDSMTISVEGEIPGKTTKTHEITYEDCLANGGMEKEEKDLITGKAISRYCEGEFIIPYGYNGDMKVTAIGAGGGGGVSSTAGYVEYKEAGSTNTFTVPSIVNKLETTLVGGGAGGGAGGKAKTSWEQLKGGQYSWQVPFSVGNTLINLKICGAGGGASISDSGYMAGGGSGAYINKMIELKVADNTIIPVIVGGKGGNGAYDGLNGSSYGGGGGGSSGKAGGNGSKPGGDGGQGNDINGGSTPTAGTGAIDGGNNGVCKASNSQSISGSGGSSGTFENVTSDSLCTAGSGGNIGGGGGTGGYTSASGGGGAASLFGVSGNPYYTIVSGGGGAAAPFVVGAGGGGLDGGNGGNYNVSSGVFTGGFGARCTNSGTGCIAGNKGEAGSTVWSYTHGRSPAPIENDGLPDANCAGGKDGAIKIFYALNASGGGGGGGASVVPYEQVKAMPLETLDIIIARRANGGTVGGYLPNGKFVAGYYGDLGQSTVLKREETILITTAIGHATHSGNHFGLGVALKGDYDIPDTADGRSGIVFDGVHNNMFQYNWKGVSTFHGLGANDAPYGTTIVGAANSNGGRGGYINLFGKEKWCTPAEGGNASHPDGFDAAQPGCGGGGGSRGGRGGSGAGGYARISWNKYWDTALNSGKGGYKYADIGTAGGGGSGNIVTYTVSNLKSEDKIKIRIGKGGEGASVNDNVITNATKGGDTVFGQNKASVKIIAGGGNPGNNPTITGTHPDTAISNGFGGDINNDNNAYSFNNKNLTTQCNNTTIINNCYIKGIKGNDGTGTKGGNGANLPNNSKVLGKSNIGNTGGIGGTTGSNAKGTNAYDKGVGSGGGGAGILDIGTPTISTHNPNTGGNGSNGKILLEWWE